MSWLENLKEEKKQRGVSMKWIAEKSGIPEKTLVHIFAGDTAAPKINTLLPICGALDVRLDDILADTMTVLGTKSYTTLQVEVEKLDAELTHATAKIAELKDTVASLTAELDLLRLKLEHKEEIIGKQKKIIALHDYYMGLKSNE